MTTPADLARKMSLEYALQYLQAAERVLLDAGKPNLVNRVRAIRGDAEIEAAKVARDLPGTS